MAIRAAQPDPARACAWPDPGRSQEFVFFIIRGANHANLYKNLIKIQIFNVNLGTIGGPGPCPPPVSAPVTIYIDFKCTICTRRPPGWWLLVCKVPTLLVVPTFPKMLKQPVGSQNWHKTRFAGNLDESVRPITQTGQTGQDNFVKLSIGFHHCVDLIKTIEMYI